LGGDIVHAVQSNISCPVISPNSPVEGDVTIFKLSRTQLPHREISSFELYICAPIGIFNCEFNSETREFKVLIS
jgi:hypothetical protein